MKQNICYYLTGFGFGHLTRSLAIMEQLLRQRQDVHIMVKADNRLLEKAGQYLKDFEDRVSLHPFHSHFSIVFDPATFCLDMKATQNNVLGWLANLPVSAALEQEFIKNQNVRLVLSDIVPEAFAAARQADCSSIGISNFTWYEICADMMQGQALDKLLDMYKQADCMLVYPFSTGALIPMEHKISVGPVVRPFDKARIAQIRAKYKQAGRPLAFLSVGGSTRLADVPVRADMDYLVTMGIEMPEMPNVHMLPPEMSDSHNYLAACDLAITKCGWSTVAEATLAGIPMWLMLSKNGWLEERCVYAEIAKLGIGRAKNFNDMQEMTSETLFNEIAVMKEAYSQLTSIYQNGMDKIMHIMQSYLV